MRNQRIIIAAIFIAAIVAGHLLFYQYVAGMVTDLAWDEVNDIDRARNVRLVMQIPLLFDLALICALVGWVAVRNQEVAELDALRRRHTSLRRAFEKDRKLSDVESRVQAMFKYAPHGLLLFDGEGRLLLANAAATELFRLDRKQLADIALPDLLAEQPVEDFDDLSDALRGKGPRHLKLALQTTTQNQFTADSSLNTFVGSKDETLILLTVELPAAAPAKTAPVPGNYPLVLVADDEGIVRLLMQTMLERMGYTPLMATTGQEAVELFTEYRERIVVVILDLVMPQMDGVATSKKIREMSANMPVLFCSGYAEIPSAAAADQKMRLIRKPFCFEVLSMAVNSAVVGSAHA